jgi:hypothetical protein
MNVENYLFGFNFTDTQKEIILKQIIDNLEDMRYFYEYSDVKARHKTLIVKFLNWKNNIKVKYNDYTIVDDRTVIFKVNIVSDEYDEIRHLNLMCDMTNVNRVGLIDELLKKP